MGGCRVKCKAAVARVGGSDDTDREDEVPREVWTNERVNERRGQPNGNAGRKNKQGQLTGR